MRKLFGHSSLLLVVMATIGAISVACGGGDGDGPTATATTRPTATAPTTPPTATPSGLVGDATRGEQLFVSETCNACHSTGDNPIVGPGLKGVADRAASRGGDAYLIESIKDPGAVVVEGFSPIMSSFAHLDDQTVADLVAYLNTLQ